MTSYWILAVLVVSLMLMGLDYSFGDALFLGILLVPGCLASRWLIPKILGIIMAVFAYCDYLLSDFITNKYKDEDRDITFTSDYRKISLKVAAFETKHRSPNGRTFWKTTSSGSIALILSMGHL